MTIPEETGKTRIAVAAEELFQVLITYKALRDLVLNPGETVGVNFRSNSVMGF